jgi:Zn-finger nucleic acid-binding protein
MNCPACDRPLTPITANDITVDACDGGCGGLWFDHFEFKKFDEPSEPAAELLSIHRDAHAAIDPDKRYHCPKCTDDVVMMRHFASVKRQVTIDECPECGGIWLDAGELGRVRNEFPSEEARHAAADAYFADVVDPILAAEHAKSEAELERAQRFAHALRFACPSYYLPGKQAGAAF